MLFADGLGYGPVRGKSSGTLSALRKDREALALECRVCCRGPDVTQKRLRIRVRRILRQCDRIDDRRVGVLWKHADNLYGRVCCRIGRIDDAERSLAARHEEKRGAHAFGLRDPVLDALPRAKLLERDFSALAGWDR